jgi:hypothetical protein
MDPLGSVREMITGMLAGIRPDARLTELGETPEWYTIRLHVLGTITKPFVVPKGLVVSARDQIDSRRILANVLRVEVRLQQIRNAIDSSREALAGSRLEPETICSRCSTSIKPGESVRFEHGEVFHMKCG